MSTTTGYINDDSTLSRWDYSGAAPKRSERLCEHNNKNCLEVAEYSSFMSGTNQIIGVGMYYGSSDYDEINFLKDAKIRLHMIDKCK